MLIRVALIAPVVFALAAVLAAWLAQRRWHEATGAMEQRLSAAAHASSVTAYSESELDSLPAPVARYFRTALKGGQPIIKRARILWEGEFNMGEPGAEKWVPMTATQLFVPGAPGFVWDARMAVAPGMPVLVRDGFVDGAGSMQGAILGLKKVVQKQGTAGISEAALQRYLGEAAWFPTALLPSQGVQWAPIDEFTARATLTVGGSTAVLEFRFRPDGLVASTRAPGRVFDNGKSPPKVFPWVARNLRYTEYSGIKVPAEAVAEWQLPNGPYQYWRGKVTGIEFDGRGLPPPATGKNLQ